jgi:hypothetical protein
VVSQPHITVASFKGPQNSEIQFGIGISETEPNYISRIPKSRNSGILTFQISEVLTFYGICFQDEMFDVFTVYYIILATCD